MIYLIRAGETGPFCKIGKADDPVARMRDLQCGNPEVLVLVKVWPGDILEEFALRRAFSEYHYRGEWLHYCDAMLDADPARLVNERGGPARTSPVALAIAAAGGVVKLASILQVQPQAVSQWKKIPFKRAKQINKALGIPLHDLRVDIWDAPDSTSTP